MYNVIVSPHLTEKATLGSEHNQVTFKVAGTATKPQIKDAVEALFGVKVKGVNTLVQKARPSVLKALKAAAVTSKKQSLRWKKAK